MALMYAQYPEPEPIERAVKVVMSRQLPVCLQYHFSRAIANAIVRMALGRKKLLKVCSTKLAPLYTRISNIHSRCGCLVEPIIIWPTYEQSKPKKQQMDISINLHRQLEHPR